MAGSAFENAAKLSRGFIKFYQLDRELCSIEGCQCYICAPLTFDAKVPLAQRELLVEVPSLRVILLSQTNTKLVVGGDSRHRSEFEFSVFSGQLIARLNKLQLHHASMQNLILFSDH